MWSFLNHTLLVVGVEDDEVSSTLEDVSSTDDVVSSTLEVVSSTVVVVGSSVLHTPVSFASKPEPQPVIV